MNDEFPPGLPERIYSQMIEAARAMGEETLRRLLELHNRYPSDLPAKAFELLFEGRHTVEEDAQRSDSEGDFSRQ